MRKFYTILALFVLANTVQSIAQNIITVAKDPTLNPNYDNLQNAINGAQNGDIIYVYPGNYSEGVIVNKPLSIIGYGYLLTENNHIVKPITVTNTYVAGITFKNSSSGSSVSSIHFGSMAADTLESMLIQKVHTPLIVIRKSNNITIQKCYFEHFGSCNQYDGFGNGSGSMRFYNILIMGNSSNIIIKNNYFFSRASDAYWCNDPSTYFGYGIWAPDEATVEICNNVFDCRIRARNSVIKNNIQVKIRSTTELGNDISTCIYTNNISYNASFGTNNGNQANVNISDIFVGSTVESSPDARYILKEGSPAIGAGVNGEDCGMFGGNDPYVISGIPNIPMIQIFEAPDAANQTEGLPVRIKVKSNK